MIEPKHAQIYGFKRNLYGIQDIIDMIADASCSPT